MKKSKLLTAGVLAIILVLGLVMVGCKHESDPPYIINNNTGGGLTGTWKGNIGGAASTIVITATGYTFTDGTNTDSGTYTMNGITASLYSTQWNVSIGTAVLLDSNTISVTLNANSGNPGTYTLYRQ